MNDNVPYGLTAAVLDSNSSRAEALLAEVSRLRPQAYNLLMLHDANELRLLLSPSRRGVLFIEARGVWEGVEGLVLAGEVAAHGGMQVVFVDGSPTVAYEVYAVSHVALLPPSPSPTEVSRALVLAEAHLDARLARPLLVRSKGSERVIWPRRVVYVESDRRILHIHADGEVVSVYAKLSDLAAQLPPCFIQCHKSFLANLTLVDVLGHGGLLMTTGDVVPVSQKRRAAVREALREWTRWSM